MTTTAAPGVLGAHALRAIVEDLAAEPRRWRHLVRHEPAERVCVELRRDEEIEVWLICWLPGHDTGFHDHGDAAAAITVVEGIVREERLSLRGPVGRTYQRGATVDVPERAIHRVRHGGGGPAVSIHAYSPPLDTMGAYTPDAVTGELRRGVVAGDEALTTVSGGAGAPSWPSSSPSSSPSPDGPWPGPAR